MNNRYLIGILILFVVLISGCTKETIIIPLTTGSSSNITGGSSPGGSNGNIQFNDNGVLNGSSNFNYSKSDNKIILGKDINIFKFTGGGYVRSFISTYGTQNLFFGVNSGNDYLTGTYNLVFGSEAGAGLTTGSENLCIGYNSCGIMTEGSTNLMIGTASGSSISVGNNNILIGNTGETLVSDSSYQLMIGNYAGTPVYGGYIDLGMAYIPNNLAIGSTYMTSTSTIPYNGLIVEGYTGLGTDNPSSTLDIVGTLEVNNKVGITKNITIMKTAVTSCSLNFSGGVLFDTTC